MNCEATEFLLAAAIGRNPVKLRDALELGAEVDGTDSKGWSALMWVAMRDDDDMALDLLEAGANAEIECPVSGMTPLHWAAQAMDVALVRRLLDMGVAPNPFDASGRTPLDLAKWSLNEEEDERIRAKSMHVPGDELIAIFSTAVAAQSGIKSPHADKALWLSAKLASLGGVNEALSAGAAVDSRDPDGFCALDLACQWESGNPQAEEIPSIVARLVEAGARLDAVDLDGLTPLHWAAAVSGAEVVRQLITAGAHVGATSPDGNTPLHEAVWGNDADCVAVLLDANADVNAPNNDGVRPLDFAIGTEAARARALLLAYGAIPGARLVGRSSVSEMRM